MLKETQKGDDQLSKEVQEDIQFLLSNIRARENGLIFFLERFTSEGRTKEEFSIFKEEFLQKEKIYANQVSRLICKYTNGQQAQEKVNQYMKTFWIKCKSIIKVSLDRLRLLKLLNERIFVRYEEIITMINKNYDEGKDLEYFSLIENILKKRNIDALIFSRHHSSSPNSDSKIIKNRSESAIKQIKYSPKPSKNLPELFEIEQCSGVKLKFDDNHKDEEERMKSLNRYRKKKILLESKNSSAKEQEKNYKKVMKNMDKFQKSVEDVMDCVIDLNIDKKKTMKENEENLYDKLFSLNIPNHKMISKFLFGSCGIAQLLIKRKNLKIKKKILENKNEKNFREKNKSRQPKEEKERERPQSSNTVQVKGIIQEEKERASQTTLIFHEKKSKYRRKIGGRVEKYTKLIKVIT